MRFLETAPERWEVQLQALWAVVALAAVATVLAVACMAARAAQAVAETSLEAARLTAAAAVHASESAGARAAATLAAALGEPATRSAQAAERFAESMHDFRRAHTQHTHGSWRRDWQSVLSVAGIAVLRARSAVSCVCWCFILCNFVLTQPVTIGARRYKGLFGEVGSASPTRAEP